MAYPGGKSGAGVYQTIINHIPPHHVYIEPFVGGGGVLKKIKPARSIIAIDIDPSAIENLILIPGIHTIIGDGIQYMKDYDYTGNEFLYCDPPYLMSTRKSNRRIYKQEWTELDHFNFLKIVKKLPCRIAMSGYNSELYQDMLEDWNKITFIAQTRRGPATEVLWMNYPKPTVLHDCRYLGRDFRERERIKRKATRWAKNFSDMPQLEQQAILSAIINSSESTTDKNSDGGSEHL